MPPEALLTGATGFIGGHLAEYLTKAGWNVLCLCREKSRVSSLEKKKISILRGDIRKASFLKEAVRGQRYIFHLAARIRSASKEVYDQANRLFTQNLVRAAAAEAGQLRRFVYVSSISAAGPSAAGTFSDEDTPEAPVSEYGRTKRLGEECLIGSSGSFPWTIIRPPNVYGRGQQETEMLYRLIRAGIVPILRQREPATSLIYVKDLVRGMTEAALSAKAEGNIYFLTDGKAHSWREVILILKREIRGRRPFLPLPESLITSAAAACDLIRKSGLARPFFGRRAWRAMIETHWLFSAEKAARDFGFRPEYSLEEGLRDTVREIRERMHS